MDGMPCWTEDVRAAVARDNLREQLERESTELEVATTRLDELQSLAAAKEEANRV